MDSKSADTSSAPDWPKLGPSLLIAASVILAIRTAKWPAVFYKSTAHPELDKEIDFAANLTGTCPVGAGVQAGRDVAQQRVSWYQPSDGDMSE